MKGVEAALERLRVHECPRWHPCTECDDLALVAQALATLETDRDALRAFLDFTVRGWISDLDDHKSCDNSCPHRGMFDALYEELDRRALLP